jgi:hypothetical protein
VYGLRLKADTAMMLVLVCGQIAWSGTLPQSLPYVLEDFEAIEVLGSTAARKGITGMYQAAGFHNNARLYTKAANGGGISEPTEALHLHFHITKAGSCYWCAR